MSKFKPLKKALKKITRSKFATLLVSRLLYLYVKFTFATSRWEIRGLDNILNTWMEEGNFILVGWHGRALMMPMIFKKNYHPEMRALVSLHNDGRIIAGILEKCGIKTIGGSTSNNAKGAAVNIMHTLNNKISVTIIPDGPRGPRMRMSMSPVYFAHKTGKPLIGMVYSAKKAKIIEKAWDKMMIPAPFNQGIYLISEPFYVPKDADEKDLERYRLDFEKIMNNLNDEADRAMGIPPILPSDCVKTKKHPAEKK